ncbi:hypothetical protein PLESTB_001493600 [Pleodorina starrii]|uniref:Secreted protein n=1 Tax=Pleodorina starrii TaxID=330485 RepID=A0A9W6BX69_9CHLO|nr:hypothetical protein PLESTB_001493600 [Pleodorina starrii]
MYGQARWGWLVGAAGNTARACMLSAGWLHTVSCGSGSSWRWRQLELAAAAAGDLIRWPQLWRGRGLDGAGYLPLLSSPPGSGGEARGGTSLCSTDGRHAQHTVAGTQPRLPALSSFPLT